MKQNEFKNIMNQITLSEQNKQQIINNCKKQKHVDNKLFLYSGRIAAALGITILSATSLTAYAAVSAYQAYMEQMSAEEVQERYDNLHEGTKEGDSFSRRLSSSERDRMNRLREEYRQGLRFPTTSMYCFDGNTVEKPTDVAISYDYVNMIFYIPASDLTDEELLQIIDVWEKGNYSLNVTNEHNLTDAEKSTEESAEATVSAVCGRDISDMTWRIVLYGDINPQYLVTIEDESRKYNIIYTPDSTPDNLVVRRYHDFDLTTSENPKTAGYTQEQIQEKLPLLAEDAKKTLSESFGISTKVTKCEYAYDQAVLDGISSGVLISLTTENGNRYKFSYSLRESILREMLTYDAGKYDDVDYLSFYDVCGIIE